MDKMGADNTRQQTQQELEFASNAQVRVLTGNHADWGDGDKLFLDLIKGVPGEKREVVGLRAETYSALMQAAHGERFNLCVVILNNIINLPNRSVDGMAAFVRDLKQACRCPVIALAGWPDDVSLGEKVVNAGASAFFRLPFPVPEFVKVVRTCLSVEMAKDRKPKVLATDDDLGTLESIRIVLETAGYEVETFVNNIKALERIQSAKPDVVITDLFAPRLSGFDFIQWVKKLAPAVPVIVLSGSLLEPHDIGGEKAKRALQCGAFACMAKPFAVAELRQAVARALEARRESSQT
jgi:CheY-like chemotaxis protein